MRGNGLRVYRFSPDIIECFCYINDMEYLVGDGKEVISISPDIDVVYDKDAKISGEPLTCILSDVRGISLALHGSVYCFRHGHQSVEYDDVAVIQRHIRPLNVGSDDEYAYDLLMDLRCEYPDFGFELEMLSDDSINGLVIYDEVGKNACFISWSKYRDHKEKYLLSDVMFDYQKSINPLLKDIEVLDFRFKAFPNDILFEVSNGVSSLLKLSKYLDSDLVVVPLNRGRFWAASFDGDVVSLLAWHQEFCGHMNRYANMYICKMGTSILHLYDETVRFYRSVYCKGTVLEITTDTNIGGTFVPRGSRLEIDFVDDALNIQGHWLPPKNGNLSLYLMSDRYRIVYNKTK